MIKSALKKLKTLHRLIVEYKNISFLATSLYEYLKLRFSLDKQYVESRKGVFMFRLPNGLRAITLANPKYLRAYVATYGEIFVMGIYDQCKDFIPIKHDIVLDLGAFIGLYTLKHYKAERIFTFEPHPISYILLYNNVKLNELKNVRCFNYAIWCQNGHLPLYEDKFLVSSSATALKSYKGSPQKKFIVRAVSIDQLINQRILPPHIDIAKVDIEGSEVEFLEGGAESLSRGRINRIIIEVHKTEINLRKFYDKLRELNFKVVHKMTYYKSDIVYAIHIK